MTLYLMYASIILITIIFFIIIKDKVKALKITGTLTISSSILLIVMMFLIKIFINNSITIINISSITNYLFKKFIYASLILFLIGLSEIVISKFIYYKKVKT